MIKYFAITDMGICDKNDDRITINGKIISSGMIDGKNDKSVLATVCDGVGGNPCGDEAAEITSEIFSSLAVESLSQIEIETTLADANKAVMKKQASDADHKNMATTIAGIYINENDIISFNVGDSKIFRFRNPYLMQLSADHTSAQQSAELGMNISENSRNTITCYIGDEYRCRPSIVVGENRVFQGDVYLICSDGLSDVVSNEEIVREISEPSELSVKCENLLNLALTNGSQDNISVILMEVAQ